MAAPTWTSDWTDGANSIHAGDAAGGDLAGTYPNPTVATLQGRAVSNSAPGNAQALVWDGLTTGRSTAAWRTETARS